jgi:hypothetical protein
LQPQQQQKPLPQRRRSEFAAVAVEGLPRQQPTRVALLPLTPLTVQLSRRLLPRRLTRPRQTHWMRWQAPLRIC